MKPLVSLVLLGLGCGLLWYAEVLWLGWDGLIWTRYTHLAPFVGAAAFLAWLAWTPTARSQPRRAGLIGLAALWAALCIWRQEVTWRAFAGLMDPLAFPELVASTLAMPAGAFCIGYALGYRLRLWTLPVSVLLVVMHMIVPPLFGDVIHSIKAGWSVPWVVIGLGLPWAVPSERELDVA